MRTERSDIFPESPDVVPERKEGFGDLLKELPLLVIVAFGIALLIKTFVLQAFFIPSGSMENTLLIGDRVLVSKFVYRFSEPKYKDIVVFVSPLGGTTPRDPDEGAVGRLLRSAAEGLGLRSLETDFIKRVIATEGQTVEVKEGAVYVNNKKLTEPYIHDNAPMPNFGPVTVEKDKVFVMGDNRNNSQDSRVFGAIPESSILGRAFILIWPLERLNWMID